MDSCKQLLKLVAASVIISPVFAATITVDNASSGSVGGACTLQDAVTAANTNAAVNGCAAGSVGADSIVFAAGITQITLTAPMLVTLASSAAGRKYSAGLVVSEDLTIDGGAVPGSGIPNVTIQRSNAAGTASFGVLYAQGVSDINVTLAGLTLANGASIIANTATTYSDGTGGGVGVPIGHLNVHDSAIVNNTAGGGIYAAQIALSYSTVSGNLQGGVVGGYGSISHSTISGNSSLSGGGVLGNPFTIDASSITGNTAGEGGGFAGNGTLTNTIISNNISTGAGGATQPNGGGVLSPSANGGVTLIDCDVSNNTANTVAGVYSLGGGISVAGKLVLTRTTVRNNQAGSLGGGIFANAADVSGSTISGNTARGGGGLYSYALIHVDSSTFSGNTATGGNPAAVASAGGGIYAGNAVLTDVTISGNAAPKAAGIAVDGRLDMQYVTITANVGAACAGLCPSGVYPSDTFAYGLGNTVIAGNSGISAEVDGLATVSGDHNWIGSVGAAVTVDAGAIINSCAALGLSPLANNGGLTQTHAIVSGSCLIGAGTPTGTVYRPSTGLSSTVSSDQRGNTFPRVVGSRSDIGAFEFQRAAVEICHVATRAIPDSGAFIRYLQGITGSALMAGLYPPAEVSDAAAAAKIADFTANADAYDFNGDGSLDALVDGELYARYVLGLRGSALFPGLAVGVVRTTAQIESALAACH